MDSHDGPIEFGDHDSGYEPDDTTPGGEVDGDLGGGQLPEHGYGDEPVDADPDTDPGDGDVAHPDTGDGVGLEFGELSDDGGHDADAFTGADEDDQQDPGLDADPLPGTDPDVDHVGDDPDWAADDVFPPQLDIGETPEPVDGFPWSDPAVLGDEHDLSGHDAADPGAAPGGSAGDLADYDGQAVPAGADPWQVLAGSDDPATSSLARFWAPGS